MNDNNQSPLGLKILIQKHHHFIFKVLEALLQISLAYWFRELQVLKHGCWSLKAPFPLSYLFPILRDSIAFPLPFPPIAHSTVKLLLLNPLLELFISLACFFFFWALPSFLSDSYTPTDEKDLACKASKSRDFRDKKETQLLSSLCHYAV